MLTLIITDSENMEILTAIKISRSDYGAAIKAAKRAKIRFFTEDFDGIFEDILNEEINEQFNFEYITYEEV